MLPDRVAPRVRHVAATGLHPLRPKNFDERLPYPGTGEAEWRGFLSRKRDPHVINPRQGYLFNWNNMPSVGWTQGDAPARERLLGGYHRSALIRLRLRKAIKAGGGFARTAAIDAFTGTHAEQRVLMTGLLRRIRRGATGHAAAVLRTILRWDGSFARTNGHGTVDPGVAAWQTFTNVAFRRALGRYEPAVDLLTASRNDEHVFESTWGEVYALQHLSRRALHAAAASAFAVLRARFGSAKPKAWREPRRLYHPGSQGAASMPDIPFLDRGTFEQAVELGP